MALPLGRRVSVGETPYAHEQEGIKFALDALPDRDPYHAWALVDLLDPSTGRLLEIDLLVLGYSCLYLVELKAYAGRIQGDSVDWNWTTPEGRQLWRDNPRSLARRKAQILKTRLERALPPGARAPWVEPLVFLTDAKVEIALSPDGLIGVVGRSGFANAITHHDFPGADSRHQGRPIDRPTHARRRPGDRRHRPQAPQGQGSIVLVRARRAARRDRLPSRIARPPTATTRPSVNARASTPVPEQASSVERRQQLRRAAEREAQLLYEVHEHPNILSYFEFVSDAPLGPTVLFDDFDGGMPLDAFLRNEQLDFDARIEIIEQVARALEHCHRKGVIHGGLSPEAVLVRRHPGTGQLEVRLFNFQLGFGPPSRRPAIARSSDR